MAGQTPGLFYLFYMFICKDKWSLIIYTPDLGYFILTINIHFHLILDDIKIKLTLCWWWSWACCCSRERIICCGVRVRLTACIILTFFLTVVRRSTNDLMPELIAYAHFLTANLTLPFWFISFNIVEKLTEGNILMGPSKMITIIFYLSEPPLEWRLEIP